MCFIQNSTGKFYIFLNLELYIFFYLILVDFFPYSVLCSICIKTQVKIIRNYLILGKSLRDLETHKN